MNTRSTSALSRRTVLNGALVGIASATGIAGIAVTPACAAPPNASSAETESPLTSEASLVTPGLTVTRMKVLAGTQSPVQFGVAATDLGAPTRTPDGRLLFVFGDTWADYLGGANWRSPVALYSSTTDLATGVSFNGCAGAGTDTQGVAPQLWAYQHDSYISTVIPSDVITIGSRMYLHAIVNGPTFGKVRWTELWKSDDNGETWQHTGVKFPTDMAQGRFQCITWGLGSDGYVYIYGTGFQRDKGIVLYRVRSESMTTLSAYEPWGFDGSWGWGKPVTEVLPGTFGEMSLRPLDGKWILTWFNAGDYRIDAMILNTPTDDLYAAKKVTLLSGGDWGAESSSVVAQLYGGYIIPGSTLSDLHLSVSQWNTGDNSVYHAEQFRFQGLADLY